MNVVVVGLFIFDVVVDSFVDVDDARLAFFKVVVDFCVAFVNGGSDVAVDPCADVVVVCCSLAWFVGLVALYPCVSVIFDTDVDPFVDVNAVELVVFGVVDPSAAIFVVALVIFGGVLVSFSAVVDVILVFFDVVVNVCADFVDGGLVISDATVDSFVAVVDVSFIRAPFVGVASLLPGGNVIGLINFAVDVDSFVPAFDARLVVFDAEIDSCLDVGVVGRAPCVLVLVVDSCFGAVVGSFAFDVAVDPFVDVVDDSFI